MGKGPGKGARRHTTAPSLCGPVDVVRFVCSVLGPSYGSRAAVVVVGLDAASRVIGLAENRHRWTPRSLRARELVDLATELRARVLVLVQLVPSLSRAPNMTEAHAFHALATRCASEGLHVVDCIVLSGDRWWSLGRMVSERAKAN